MIDYEIAAYYHDLEQGRIIEPPSDEPDDFDWMRYEEWLEEEGERVAEEKALWQA